MSHHQKQLGATPASANRVSSMQTTRRQCSKWTETERSESRVIRASDIGYLQYIKQLAIFCDVLPLLMLTINH